MRKKLHIGSKAKTVNATKESFSSLLCEKQM